MERPAKRMRMWKPEASTSSTITTSEHSKPSQPPLVVQQQATLPTRTIDLSDFRRRAFHAYRSGEGYTNLKKRNGGIYLMPRAPIATVTAKIIDVAVDDGDGAGLKVLTHVAEPTSDLVVSLGSMGSLTIPGAGPITSDLGSLVSELTGSSTLGASGSGITNAPNSASANGTSVASGGNTATVTTTSTFAAIYRNGTLIVPSRTSAFQTTSSTDQSRQPETTSDDGDATSTSMSENGSGDGATRATSNGNTAIVLSTTSASPQATISGSSGSGGGSGVTLTPQQQQVVGGVVGGVAGVALILVALLYFLKWYRQRLKRLGQLPEQIAASRDAIHAGAGNDGDQGQAVARPQTAETQRSSIGPIAAIATRLKQLRPYSTNTVATASTRDSLPSGNNEKSFQRMAGRKIPSVLSAGGDGYGGSYGVFDQSAHQRDESQTSIYQDDFVNARPFTRHQPNSMSEPSTPTQSDPFADPPSVERMARNAQRSFSPTPNFSRPSLSRDFGYPKTVSQPSHEQHTRFSPVLSPVEGFATLRPSPARTPMTQSPTGSAVRIPQPSSTPPLMAGHVPDLPSVPTLHLPPNRRTDKVGRSFTTETASAGRISTRSTSGISGRTSSTAGRFRENID